MQGRHHKLQLLHCVGAWILVGVFAVWLLLVPPPLVYGARLLQRTCGNSETACRVVSCLEVIMFHTLWLIVPVLASVLFLDQRAVADDKADAAAKETVEELFKALIAKDIDRLMKVVDVPWCIMDRKQIVKDRDELKKRWQKGLDRRDYSTTKIAVKLVAPLSKMEASLGKKLPKDSRKLLEEVLGKDHRMVLIEIEQGERKHTIVAAVRLQDGKARVVSISE